MIKLIKLIDSTEIIGSIDINTDNTVTMTDPLQVNYYTRTPASVPVIALHRYMPLSEQTQFIFNSKHILSTAEPKQGLVEYYKAMLKEVIEQFDNNLNSELLEKAGVMISSSHDSEDRDLAEAVLERMLKKPILN